MKAVTIDIPYAPLIAFGYKHWETRYKTNYRGDIVIHTSKNKRGIKYFEHELMVSQMMGFVPENSFVSYILKFMKENPQVDIYNLYGKALCIATLVDCVPCYEVHNLSRQEEVFGYWHTMRHAWKLENIRLLPEFVSIRGQQRLWNIDPKLVGLEE